MSHRAVPADQPLVLRLVVEAAAASLAEHCGVIVLDCIGYDEHMRASATDATGRRVLLGRSLAARLTGELLA